MESFAEISTGLAEVPDIEIVDTDQIEKERRASNPKKYHLRWILLENGNKVVLDPKHPQRFQSWLESQNFVIETQQDVD